jgi:predicted enzyme related to lactoylglutathione lyase
MSGLTAMRIKDQVVVFDAADLATESRFWASVLGGRVDAEDDWHMVVVDDEPRVGVQLAPDHIPPQWPDGSPQQIHLDLWVEDIGAAHDEVMSLGAKLLKAAEETPAAAAATVMRVSCAPRADGGKSTRSPLRPTPAGSVRRRLAARRSG